MIILSLSMVDFEAGEIDFAGTGRKLKFAASITALLGGHYAAIMAYMIEMSKFYGKS